MSKKSIGLNGFGRIGRYLMRLVVNNPDMKISVINARADNQTLAHLLKYDSVHGKFPGTVEPTEKGIKVNGEEILVTRNALNEWEWGKLGVDLVVENTGKIKNREGLYKHVECGAKKVVMSAPVKDADCTIVMGINHNSYDPNKDVVISSASCTTNCLAHPAKVLNDAFGIKHGVMTTVHSYTMSQRILDGSHKDLRRARAAGVSMIPTTTGAAATIGVILPELKGKLDGMSIRVPMPNVSLVDLTCELKKEATIQDINNAMKAASEGAFKDIMGYTDEPLVSCDFLGSTYAGVFDAGCTSVTDGVLAKVIVWYDNEASFTNQLYRLLSLVIKKM